MDREQTVLKGGPVKWKTIVALLSCTIVLVLLCSHLRDDARRHSCGSRFRAVLWYLYFTGIPEHMANTNDGEVLSSWRFSRFLTITSPRVWPPLHRPWYARENLSYRQMAPINFCEPPSQMSGGA